MSRIKHFYVGDKVKWSDPDPIPGACQTGTIVWMQYGTEADYDDEIVSLVMDDGGCVECLKHEMTRLWPEVK